MTTPRKKRIETATEKDIRTLLYFLTVKGYTRKKEDAAHNIELSCRADAIATLQRFEKRLEICRFEIGWLYRLTSLTSEEGERSNGVRFSVVELLNDLKADGELCLTP